MTKEEGRVKEGEVSQKPAFWVVAKEVEVDEEPILVALRGSQGELFIHCEYRRGKETIDSLLETHVYNIVGSRKGEKTVEKEYERLTDLGYQNFPVVPGQLILIPVDKRPGSKFFHNVAKRFKSERVAWDKRGVREVKLPATEELYEYKR